MTVCITSTEADCEVSEKRGSGEVEDPTGNGPTYSHQRVQVDEVRAVAVVLCLERVES